MRSGGVQLGGLGVTHSLNIPQMTQLPPNVVLPHAIPAQLSNLYPNLLFPQQQQQQQPKAPQVSRHIAQNIHQIKHDQVSI